MSIERIIDAHIHQWDPARADWYSSLASGAMGRAMGIDDVSRMERRFDQEIYLGESKNWNVEKYVHVACADFSVHQAEMDEREEEGQATGHPNALIGKLDYSLPVSDIAADLDQQLKSSRFRGVRMVGVDYASVKARDVFHALEERGIVYDLVVHPAEMRDCAEFLQQFGSLTVVVEHTGWPLSLDEEHVTEWKVGMHALAGMGERIHCKISGLAMTLRECRAAAFRPWIEHAIEAFGDNRCLFASNFPVDGLFGTFDDLYGAYDEVTAGLDPVAREKIFASNAESVYAC